MFCTVFCLNIKLKTFVGTLVVYSVLYPETVGTSYTERSQRRWKEDFSLLFVLTRSSPQERKSADTGSTYVRFCDTKSERVNKSKQHKNFREDCMSKEKFQKKGYVI